VTERPQVTVSDPGRPAAGAEVLGDDAPPRRLPSWAGPLAAGALLAAVAVPPAVSAVEEDRREDRAARVAAAAAVAERARDDAVPVLLTRPAVGGGGESGVITVAVTAGSSVTDSRSPAVVVDALRLTGSLFDGMEPVAVSGVVDPAEPPAYVTATFPVDCTAVASAFRDGSRPRGVSLVLVVTPRSGRQQETAPAGLPDVPLQDALLDACQLGDPAVAPVVDVVEVGGRLVARVSVDRGQPVTLLGFRLEGVTLRPSASLPVEVGRFTGLALDLEVGRVDCARLSAGPLVALLKGADGSTREVEAVRGEDPGGSSLAEFLVRLKARRCP
jgi:hypothetical protein